jgi:hypothetical protein
MLHAAAPYYLLVLRTASENPRDARLPEGVTRSMQYQQVAGNRSAE